eukprot:TRINITY_DN20610_c0_g1_i1.p1 TRINITY_DN20610_c0_g1~~TRINITY_DN20610_c0_g1_i1.p1  ORF type:complete len:226 (-),score=42.49 TRINITY_DN20610_c0_g1_i1:170-847(-)
MASQAKVEDVEVEVEKQDTVTFNVGGTKYEVLRSPTLSLHPDSVLHQMAEDSSGPDPIFVEADPNIFQYLLAYLRCRKVHIPFTVSKDAMIHEGRVLGIGIKQEDVIQATPPLAELGRCTVDAISNESEALNAALKEQKVQLVASMVLQSVMQKVGRSARIEVRTRDALNSVGVKDDACIRYLHAGWGREDLLHCLTPWAQRNGYAISVRKIYSYYYTTFSCARA